MCRNIRCDDVDDDDVDLVSSIGECNVQWNADFLQQLNDHMLIHASVHHVHHIHYCFCHHHISSLDLFSVFIFVVSCRRVHSVLAEVAA